MKKEEFVSVMKTLGVAFNREITQELLTVYYEILKNERIENLKRATKNILQNNKYFPTVSEILVECEKQNTKQEFEILNYMESQGYFKSSDYGISEYEKAYNWLKTGIIPKWFKNDMEEYSKMYKQEQLQTNEVKRLSYE